uniref:Uncharacterized protein n=1 Tax=Anguilla anguilla TaxID=7936 RepID=A0A0E9SL92_ANGAN
MSKHHSDYSTKQSGILYRTEPGLHINYKPVACTIGFAIDLKLHSFIRHFRLK